MVLTAGKEPAFSLITLQCAHWRVLPRARGRLWAADQWSALRGERNQPYTGAMQERDMGLRRELLQSKDYLFGRLNTAGLHVDGHAFRGSLDSESFGVKRRQTIG